MISQFLTWNSDQSVAWGILWERSLSVRLLSVVGGEDEAVVLLDQLQRHLEEEGSPIRKAH